MRSSLRARPPLAVVLLGSALAVRALWLVDAAPDPAPERKERAEAATLVASTEELAAALNERVASRRAAASRSQTDARAARAWPADGALTGWWGEPRTNRLHYGVDIDGEIGDPIRSLALGTVVHAGPAPAGYGGYGNLVLVDHDGFVTLYAHLDRVDVHTGQHVPAGYQLGTMGVTGNVTGSHLHFEVRVNGQLVDPGPWLPPR